MERLRDLDLLTEAEPVRDLVRLSLGEWLRDLDLESENNSKLRRIWKFGMTVSATFYVFLKYIVQLTIFLLTERFHSIQQKTYNTYSFIDLLTD